MKKATDNKDGKKSKVAGAVNETEAEELKKQFDEKLK